MDFRQLRYMLTLAELRNMSRAADALYVSQSALSHYLKNVENELGVPLFDRSTTPMSLTYAGKCYMESARKILEENDRLLKELRDITQHLTGKLTIGTPRDRISYMMPKILPEFSRRYPGITIDLFSASRQKLLDALRSGRIDLAILPDIDLSAESDLAGEPIYQEELLLAAADGFLPPGTERSPGVIRPERLADLPFFLLLQEHAMRNWCDNWFKRNGLKVRPQMEFTTNISCYRMAAAGLGVTIIPYLTTQLACPGGDVRLYSLGDPPATWNIFLIYRKNAYLGQPEQDLLTIARDLFAHESRS